MVERVKFYLKRDTKFYCFFDNEVIFQTIIFLFLILLDRVVTSDCIVNNGNILTNGRWRCYHEMGQRISYRNT